jgi:uncharacterized membrane protein
VTTRGERGEDGVVAPTHEDPVARRASEVIGGPWGAHARGHRWWTPVRVVLAVACVAWLLALVQKAPCAADGWSGADTRYAQLCYSDLPYLYVGRGFAEGVVPFTDSGDRYRDLEYPVLIGYFAYGAAVLTQTLNGAPDLERRSQVPPDAVGSAPGVEEERREFFWVNAVLLAPLLLLTVVLLAGVNPRRPWDAMAFAAAPVLVLAGLVNWDLLAVACVAGAFWAHARGRPVLTGVAIGLGAAAKLYPVFLLGAFLVVALRRRELRDVGVTTAAAAGAWVVCNLPAVLVHLDGWQGFWSFNQERGADLGSVWLLAQQLEIGTAGVDTVNRVSLLLFAAVCVGVLVLGLRARRPPRPEQLALLVVLGFLLVNKVYSPQYVLWLLPLAVLAHPRWRDLLLWQAGEVTYFVLVWLYLGGFTSSATAGDPDPAYAAAIAVRVAAQLYLAVVVVRGVVAPWHDPVAASGHRPVGRAPVGS